MNEEIVVWAGFILLVGLLIYLNQKQRHAGPVKRASAELRYVVTRVQQEESESEDLLLWERSMEQLEAYPNEFNRLDQDIQFRKHFARYLERHHPNNEKWKPLRKAFHYEKDTVLGFKIQKRGGDDA